MGQMSDLFNKRYRVHQQFHTFNFIQLIDALTKSKALNKPQLRKAVNSESLREFVYHLEPAVTMPNQELPVEKWRSALEPLRKRWKSMKRKAKKLTTLEENGNQSHHERWVAITDCLVRFLSEDIPEDLPVSAIVEMPSFVEFVKYLDPGYVLPAATRLNYLRLQNKWAKEQSMCTLI